MTKLDVRNLTIRYGDATAARAITFALGRDEILTLVGPTGCGKTSVLRSIAGLVAPSEGEITIGRLTITPRHQPPPEKRRVGLVFQDFALFPHLNVADNIAFRLKDRTPADRWIARLGLESLRRAMPDTLSGGQKQRVALARALAHEPDVLLLDEPLASLDAALKAQLRWDIREALKAAALPAIWVTHDQTEALSVGDRMGIMNAGRLEQIGAPDDCFRRPTSRFVARFLGDATFVPGRIQNGLACTTLGNAPVDGRPGRPDDAIDVLVRPDDLVLRAADDGNARVAWRRYEGETRLYGLDMSDGQQLRVRVNHEIDLDADTRVDVRIGANHPLAVFERERSADVPSPR